MLNRLSHPSAPGIFNWKRNGLNVAAGKKGESYPDFWSCGTWATGDKSHEGRRTASEGWRMNSGPYEDLTVPQISVVNTTVPGTQPNT